MIELETERLTLRKGRTAPPAQADLEADYQRYVTGFAEPDVTFAQYQDVILGSYYKDKEGGPFGYYTIYPKGGDHWIGHCPLIPRLCTPAEIARFRPDRTYAAPYQPLDVEIGWALIIEARGQGFGQQLLRKRLEFFLPRASQVERILVNTTQKTEGFFRKFGSSVVERELNGFGMGLDRISMMVDRDDVLRLINQTKQT